MAAAARNSKAAQIAFKKWINNPSKVMAWMAKYDIDRMLKEGDGLAKIPNFLPEKVADGALAMIESYKDEVWNETSADRDPSTNNIVHKFWSTKQAPGLQDLVRAMSVLMPGRLHTFSAGKYVRTNHIEPHDDRAYADVVMEDGKVVQCSRDVAVIWYLTKDWQESYGGVLIDCETGDNHVPEFNTLVAFRIPRYHQVTAVAIDRPRYSVFGWFLLPGIHYDLFRGGEAGGGKRGRGEEKSGGSGRKRQALEGGQARSAEGEGEGRGRSGVVLRHM